MKIIPRDKNRGRGPRDLLYDLRPCLNLSSGDCRRHCHCATATAAAKSALRFRTGFIDVEGSAIEIVTVECGDSALSASALIVISTNPNPLALPVTVGDDADAVDCPSSNSERTAASVAPKLRLPTKIFFISIFL